jgi:hypothetical protein
VPGRRLIESHGSGTSAGSTSSKRTPPAADFDAPYGEIEPPHQAFVERFLQLLPPAGRVLDAACGTGKYVPMVLASARSLLGVDHAGACLGTAAAKFPPGPHRQA